MPRSPSIPRYQFGSDRLRNVVGDAAALMLKPLELDSIAPRNQHGNVAFDGVLPDKSSKIDRAVRTNDLVGKFRGFLKHPNLRRPDGIVLAYEKACGASLLAGTMKIR